MRHYTASHSQPGTPLVAASPALFELNAELLMLDANEIAIRERQRESDENKRRILKAYDDAARTGVCGPKSVYVPELSSPSPSPSPGPGSTVPPAPADGKCF